MESRSDFLVQWVGSHLHRARKERRGRFDWRKLDDNCRQNYVSILNNTIQKGLQVRIGEREPIRPNLGGRTAKVCFTEIRVSDVEEHTRRYGCLGFGFRREFVIRNGGGPVLYVACPTPGYFLDSSLWSYLDQLAKIQEAHDIALSSPVTPGNPVGRGGDDQLRQIFERQRDEITSAFYEANRVSYYMRVMSESPKKSGPYHLLDEREWRIVEAPKKPDHWISIKGQGNLAYQIPITQSDLALIVFPDKTTRRLALEQKHIWKWLFADKEEVPILLTIEECSHL